MHLEDLDRIQDLEGDPIPLDHPDVADLSAGVVTQAATATAAMSDNAQRMSAVVAALRKAGLLRAMAKTVMAGTSKLIERVLDKEHGTKIPELRQDRRSA